MSDPYIDDVSLLLHCNGADASTTFTDDSPQGLTVTAIGGAEIDTAQSKWGGASAVFNGTSDALSIDTTPAFGFGTGAWTAEAWVRPTGSIFGNDTIFQFFNTPTPTGVGWTCGVRFDGKLYFYADDPGGFFVQGTAVLSEDTWYHVRFDYDGTTIRGFLDGALEFSDTVALDFGSSCALLIGTYGDGGYWAGHLDDIRITKGVARGAELPSAEFDHSTSPASTLTDAGPLGATSLLGHSIYAVLSATLLGSPAAFAYHDFTGQIASDVVRYVMDLVTPGGLVRVPISSWQATLQTDSQCYVQCVVPACVPWLSDINEATEFVISRRAALNDGSFIEYEMARAPISASLDFGSRNKTATLSGYVDAFAPDADPPTSLDRTLSGVRSMSTSSTGLRRARTNIDWLLRPGRRAYILDADIIVAFVSYYVTAVDEYMDVGERA